MKELRLSNGGTVLLDDKDFKTFSKWKWVRGTHGYAQRAINHPQGGRGTLLLHRAVIDAPPRKQVDHINHNKLDNQRANLRICSSAQNLRGRSTPKNNTSGYKGVHPAAGRWRAMIRVNGRNKHLGAFDTPEQAAFRYNQAAEEFYGVFAHLNILPS